jgi:hypothetical protein
LFHQLINDFEAAVVAPESQNYETEVLHNAYKLYYYCGIEIMTVSIGQILLDIHWIMSSQYVLYFLL